MTLCEVFLLWHPMLSIVSWRPHVVPQYLQDNVSAIVKEGGIQHLMDGDFIVQVKLWACPRLPGSGSQSCAVCNTRKPWGKGGCRRSSFLSYVLIGLSSLFGDACSNPRTVSRRLSRGWKRRCRTR